MALDNIIDAYLNITEGCLINQLGPPFTYYMSDSLDTNIFAKNLIDLDIQSAFPYICKFYFGKESKFVQQIFNIENKLERNIFISTTLTDQTKKDNRNYLQELNLWSKIIILGYIYTKYRGIVILEYKKDGALISFKENIEINSSNIFLDFLKESEIIIKEKKVLRYLRFNKTSLFLMENAQIKESGKYKDMPAYMHEQFLKKVLIDNEIYNSELLQRIKEKYNDIYYYILNKSRMSEEIIHFYCFGSRKKNELRYLDINGELSNEPYPSSYLTHIIYPILSLIRLHR